MKSRLCLFLLLLSLAATAIAHGQGEKKARTIDDYRPRTLQELSTLLPEKFRKAIKEQADRGEVTRIVVHGELFPSRMKAVYGEMTRPLLEDKRKVIHSWANEFAGAPTFYTGPYQTEILFTEGTESYWLAVRNELLKRELKKGEVLELCVIKLGNARVGDKLEPVLLVEKVMP